jgi:cytochrome c-type biogenesis protein CcmF
MIEIIGNMSLMAIILIACATVFASFAGIRFRTSKWANAARWSIVFISVFFTITSGALLSAILQSDFRFEYVASYTESALPIGYKVAAFWAGQQGSLLLWGWILSVMCLIAVWRFGQWRGTDYLVTVAVLAMSCGFFASLILFAANPFAVIEGGYVPYNGRGLNPQLQDPGMIAHPPLLFMGYAGFTIPFAIMIGVLTSGRRDNHWLILIRRWLLVSWIFLTAGIVLGAWWAYIELGWGGYWAWDPVENASLLPWLTSTALIHSIMVQRQRGMFKWWNVSLIALTFTLCIFGTYITRSGVIDSVHAFGKSSIGNFFLIFMGMSAFATAGLMIWRRKTLKPEHELEGIVSREGAFLLANIILLTMMLTTLVGTIFPLLSGPFLNEPMAVTAPFYNKIVVPMAILLVLIMAHGPVLVYGKSAWQKISQAMIFPGVMAIAASMCMIALMWDSWADSFAALFALETFSEEMRHEFFSAIIALIVTFISTLGAGAVVVSFSRSMCARCRNTGENWLIASVRLIDKDHRRYGGQLSHLGLMLIVVGVAGSSLFNSQSLHKIQIGESVEIGSNTLTLESLHERYEANYGAVEAVVTLADRNGDSVTLKPQRRFYNGWEDQPNSQVAVLSSWRKDIYLSLVGWEEGGSITAIQVVANPLVVWIWIGGVVTVLGGVLSCLPQLLITKHRVIDASDQYIMSKPGQSEGVLSGPLAGDSA